MHTTSIAEEESHDSILPQSSSADSEPSQSEKKYHTGWLGVAVGLVEAFEDDAEPASGVLWLHRAPNGEASAFEEHHRVAVVVSAHKGKSDVWLRQDVYRHRAREDGGGSEN